MIELFQSGISRHSEDIQQECWVVFIRNLGRFNPGPALDLRGFCLMQPRYCAQDVLWRKKRSMDSKGRHLICTVEAPVEPQVVDPEADRCQEILDSVKLYLGDRTHQVLCWSLIDGLDFKEIGLRLGMSGQNAGKIFRAGIGILKCHINLEDLLNG